MGRWAVYGCDDREYEPHDGYVVVLLEKSMWQFFPLACIA